MDFNWLCCCLLLPLTCLGQVSEDFSDGNFTSAPSWDGHANLFEVSSGKLRLSANSSGDAFLSTASRANRPASWEFEVGMTFNPSSRNFCRVYLTSDYYQLNEELKGYYVQIGGSQDDVSLYRQDVLKHHKIIDGPDGMVDTSDVRVVVKVTRDQHGQWELWARYLHQQPLQFIGEVEDTTFVASHFFGFYCQFTSTRSEGFSLDNIIVEGHPIIDNVPPDIISVRSLDRYSLSIELSEPISLSGSEPFRVADHVSASSSKRTRYNTWELAFDIPFLHGSNYLLQAEVADLSGNKVSLSVPFDFWEIGTAARYQVIITEIMADPSPPLQLPEKEYLEIYNRSDSAINLMGWLLSDARNTVELDDYQLPPGSFLILCPRTSEFQGPGNAARLAVPSWPTLNNDSDLIILADSTGQIIHHVNYEKPWYRSNLKQHGGWSLEMIDPNYPCSGASNWTASLAASGGTPGKVNSVIADNPDFTPPSIVGTLAVNSKTVRISFDQELSTDPSHAPHIEIQPSLSIDTFYLPSSIAPELIVSLIDSLKTETLYQIIVNGAVDCNGNLDFNKELSAIVALPQTPDSGDLVINEVLFNPRPLGVRFVELYNRSLKSINLKNWRFARWQSETLIDFTTLSTSDRMIYPGDYQVFTEDPQKLTAHYPQTPRAAMILVENLPKLDDREGSVVLLAPDGIIIDNLRYHRDMHHPLLTDQNGVSLERVSPELDTNDPNNWYSAAEMTGYATPGLSNSQFYENSSIDEFKIEPPLFSPYSAKLPAYARFSYHLDHPGSTGTLRIFNQQGRAVRTLVNNSLLSNSGVFQWDGTNERGYPVPMGYYIVLFQAVLPDGTSRRYLETVAVAPDF